MNSNILLPLLIASAVLWQVQEQKRDDLVEGTPPSAGLVPNERVAQDLAAVYLKAIYSEKLISSQMPFDVTLKDNIWHLRGNYRGTRFGGVAEIKLRKSDGKVTLVQHWR